jgi:hypothetical protein
MRAGNPGALEALEDLGRIHASWDQNSRGLQRRDKPTTGKIYCPAAYVAGSFACTLGGVVAQAVFRGGRVTYHRIIGAILLYLLIALAFATFFIFVGLAFPDAFKEMKFEDNTAVASSAFYLSLVTLTSTGYGDIVPLHPVARSLCNLVSFIQPRYWRGW